MKIWKIISLIILITTAVSFGIVRHVQTQPSILWSKSISILDKTFEVSGEIPPGEKFIIIVEKHKSFWEVLFSTDDLWNILPEDPEKEGQNFIQNFHLFPPETIPNDVSSTYKIQVEYNGNGKLVSLKTYQCDQSNYHCDSNPIQRYSASSSGAVGRTNSG